jgi:hypothetical protein
LAGELTLLNAKTPHEQWPDIVVLAGVGVINYAIQFPRKGLTITLHQRREWCAANRRPCTPSPWNQTH